MKKLPHGYWTEDRCREEALKYTTLNEFCHGNHKAYDAARRNKWLWGYDWLERTYKLNPTDNSYCIYAYEFVEYRSVYVGLTRHKESRDRDHRRYNKHADSQSAVYLFCIEHNINPLSISKPIYLYDNLVSDDASRLEGETVSKYKSEGWIILNRIETGGLGGGFVKWTKETIKEKLSEFDRVCEIFRDKEARSAYIVASRHGWAEEILDEVFPGRDKDMKDHTVESILALAKRLGPEFHKRDCGLFVAKVLGCLVEVYKIIGYPRQECFILVFNKDYTRILGKYKNSKEAIRQLGIKTNNGSYFMTISNKLDKRVSFGYGVLKENLFKEFLESITDESIKSQLLSDYSRVCEDFDNEIRKDCEKYKNIDLSKIKQTNIYGKEGVAN